MITNENYSFNVSLSKDIYSTKEQTYASIASIEQGGPELRKKCGMKDKLCFKKTTLTSKQLLEYALEGHTLCSLFGDFPPPSPKTTYLRKDGYFTLSAKCGEFFQGSYFIGVDIDNTKYSPRDFIERLTLKPSVWYTSLSHLQADKNGDGLPDNRFRLIYVFDTLIQDKYYFRYCASRLYKMIEGDTGEEIEDKCGLSCTQYFNGTYRHSDNLNVESGLTNYIYSLSDIDVSDEGYFKFLWEGCDYKSLTDQTKEDIKVRLLDIRFKVISHSDIINSFYNIEHTQQQYISEWEKSLRTKSDIPIEIDSQLVSDYNHLPYDIFFDRYKHKYPLVYRAERTDWHTFEKDEHIIKYQTCDEDYLELPWLGRCTKDGTIVKMKDGQHRRCTLFIRGWLRRIIKPNLTPDELFFNLVNDKERFFDNSDGVLDTELIISKVQQCFSYSVESYIHDYQDVYLDAKEKCRKKKFIIHWMSKKVINPKSLSKEIRWALFDQIYDRSLSPMENLQIFLDSDIDEIDSGLSKSAIYRYCKERNILTNTSMQKKIDSFRLLHRDGLTLSEEQKYLKENGLNLSMPTITQYRKLTRVDSIFS